MRISKSCRNDIHADLIGWLRDTTPAEMGRRTRLRDPFPLWIQRQRVRKPRVVHRLHEARGHPQRVGVTRRPVGPRLPELNQGFSSAESQTPSSTRSLIRARQLRPRTAREPSRVRPTSLRAECRAARDRPSGARRDPGARAPWRRCAAASPRLGRMPQAPQFPRCLRNVDPLRMGPRLPSHAAAAGACSPGDGAPRGPRLWARPRAAR